MLDIWYTYPTTIGDSGAWVSYNHAYSETAAEDPRHQAFRIQVPIREPTRQGMPGSGEFPALTDLDAALDRRISQQGGVYVGRITGDGHRYFYFYVGITEQQAEAIISEVSAQSAYTMQYVFEDDPQKHHYWDELYPEDDDWQVIQDLEALDALAEKGDIHERMRVIEHRASFTVQENAGQFAAWAADLDYRVSPDLSGSDAGVFVVDYSHTGTLILSDITRHSVAGSRKARELGGSYNGWEAPIKK